MMKKILITIFTLTFVLFGCISPSDEPLLITGDSELRVGESITLITNTEDEVIWTSSNPEIASVENGVVTGVAEGVAEITAQKVANKNNFATYQVTVTNVNEQDEDEIKYYHTKILTIDEENKTIEFLNVPYTKYTDNTKFYQLTLGKELIPITIDDLYIGLENIYVAGNQKTKEIEVVLLDVKVAFTNIRVAIRNNINDIANDATLYHDEIRFSTISNVRIQTFDCTTKLGLPGNLNFRIKVSDDGYVEVYNKDVLLMRTKKRIIISSSSSITVSSIYRSYGNPSYEGNLEVSLVNSRLLLVNDVDLENYLTKVVPSEMPSSFAFEALRAQAVAARTFAYKDIFNKTYNKYGYSVDDSVKSQVYNNVYTNYRTNNAVTSTKGIIMTADGNPINIYYYSSSSGLTASAHEVWIEDQIIDPIPGLIGQNLALDHVTGLPITFDYQSEESMLEFFQRIRMITPDLNSPYHRWRIAMNKQQLTNTIKINLPISYRNTPNSILTYENGEWVSKEIPNDIGEVTKIYVDERGTSGVVVSLIIETTTNKFKIYNQYNIRFTIRPKDAGTTVIRQTARNTDYNYTGESYNDSVLPSGFFAIAEEGNDIVFYGGGNGHGVGMSQYGAHGYGSEGFSYQQILKAYFSDVELTNITFIYTPLNNYNEILEEILYK
ncbi:MAG TPA: SpoIID/LytB domain-containing protein [Acholeplasmataceae bacterium]|nr:SpoIID/LytB domain-containing protein [Acholeplasmataceae bacterium]